MLANASQGRRPDSKRRPDRPPRQRQDLAARGPPVRGGGDQPAGPRGGREHHVGLRVRRAGAGDVDRRHRLLLRPRRAQDQPDRHAGRPELHRRHSRRAAGRRRRGCRRQRRDGGRGAHRPALAARRQGGPGATRLRQHARPRAGRLLPRSRVAAERLRQPRRRHRDPDRVGARGPRRHRPDRHEGVRRPGRGQGCPRAAGHPGGAPGAGAGVPREADGRGRGELRRADGALPRGRGDRSRRDRHRAQARRHRRQDLPGHLRRRDQEPRHHAAAGGPRRGPALSGHAGRR